MRVLGCRWGFVLAILGIPIFGRGLATSNVLAMCGGSGLFIFGIFFWLLFRHEQKMDVPDPESRQSQHPTSP